MPAQSDQPRQQLGIADPEPLLPDYRGASIANVVPALLEHPAVGEGWMPDLALGAERIVLLVLDGLGWHQLTERAELAPTLLAMEGQMITAVAPTTTAAALTSITTGLPPGEHGMVGYRMRIDGQVLNALRWRTSDGDARASIPPGDIQMGSVFGERKPPVVTQAEFAGSGFTLAHLDPVRFVGYRSTSTLIHEIHRLVAAGESFVYAYYAGIDKVAHEYGLGPHYDAELGYADRLVADVLAGLPASTVLVVTADHGLVHADSDLVELHPDVLSHVGAQSGEARFRWLHAKPGRDAELLAAATNHHSGHGWVRSREQVVGEGMLGPAVTPEAEHRLGVVAILARGATAFADPDESGSNFLIGRHGSLTSAELHVPLLVASG
jgi:hypothetical protein